MRSAGCEVRPPPTMSGAMSTLAWTCVAHRKMASVRKRKHGTRHRLSHFCESRNPVFSAAFLDPRLRRGVTKCSGILSFDDSTIIRYGSLT